MPAGKRNRAKHGHYRPNAKQRIAKEEQEAEDSVEHLRPGFDRALLSRAELVGLSMNAFGRK